MLLQRPIALYCLNKINTYWCCVLVYVDYILIMGNSSSKISHLIATLHATFSLKDLVKLHYFLSVEVSYPLLGGLSLSLSQSKCIFYILHKTNMKIVKSITTPIVSGSLPLAHGCDDFSNVRLYKSVVGALQYAT